MEFGILCLWLFGGFATVSLVLLSILIYHLLGNDRFGFRARTNGKEIVLGNIGRIERTQEEEQKSLDKVHQEIAELKNIVEDLKNKQTSNIPTPPPPPVPSKNIPTPQKEKSSEQENTNNSSNPNQQKHNKILKKALEKRRKKMEEKD